MISNIYEWRFDELQDILQDIFTVEAVYGTFASQKDIFPMFDADEARLFNLLRSYYDSNVLSILFAPLHPESSRNAIWRLRAKWSYLRELTSLEKAI